MAENDSRQGHTKYWILAGAAVAIVIVLIIMSFLNKDPQPAQAPPSDPQPAATSTGPTVSAAATSDTNQEQRQVAAQFISAYYSQRWTDSVPGAWVERAATFTTDAYGAQLRKTYGTAQGDRTWAQLVESKATRNGIIDAITEAPAQSTPTRSILLVTFHVQIKTSSGESTDEPLATKMMVLSSEASSWKVEAFTDVTAGSDPSAPLPSADPLPTVNG
ncbi:MAG: hypothetical protein L0G87_00390 [Renibacterium salmoninarum]|nr:hypothetical protein [Renibacterium salmoninarum]